MDEPKEKPEGEVNGEVVAEAPEEAEARLVENEEETQRKLIEDLLDEGVTPVEIEKKWGFPHTTVWRIAHKKLSRKNKAKEVKVENGSEGNGNNKRKLAIVDNDIPMTLTVAGSQKQQIAPEALLKRYFLSDGEPGAWMFQGMMLLRAAQLMNLTDVEIMKGQAEAQATAIKPILDIMEQSRTDMDAAAQRAKESNMEIAAAAAQGAAGGVLGRIDAGFEALKQQQADIATVENPMEGMKARMMQTLWGRLMGLVTGQGPQVPKFADERGKTNVAGGMAPSDAPPGMVDERGGM